jgi:tRNA(Ile)-lysidine synthase
VLDCVAGIISRYNMLQPGDRVGIAVSGGADSVCLLHVLRELAPKLGVSLAVLHLNHKLRAEESDADAQFVSALARNFGLPLAIDAVDVASIDDNLEQAGRNARRTFYRKLIESGWIDRVATGHTRSDQAETILYRLLRGSGTAGLAGIVPVTEEGIVRPLLECDRSEVERFLTVGGFSWREDRSNQDPRFVRNRIRHQLLPLLAREYNPGIADVLASMANVARDEESFWNRELQPIRHKSARGAVLLRVQDLRVRHRAEQRRVLRRAVLETKGNLKEVGVSHIESILALVESREGDGRVQIPGVDVRRSFDWLRMIRPGSDEPGADYSVELNAPARVALPHTSGMLCVDLMETASLQGNNKGYNELSFLDFDRLCGPLTVRNWRPGDRYAPEGSDEKIKQLFQRARIPVWERRGWPVMTSGDKVVWAKGFGVAADLAPDAGTRALLRIREEPCGDSSESNSPQETSERRDITG